MNNYTFKIKDNIDFDSTKQLIKIYKETLTNGVVYDNISININPDEGNLNGEIDPVFLTYLFLYITEFNINISFNFSRTVTKGRYFSFRHLIRYFAFQNPSVEIKIKGAYFLKDGSIKDIQSIYLNKKENNVSLFNQIDKTQPNKKFIPPIIIESKYSINKYFLPLEETNDNLENKFFKFSNELQTKYSIYQKLSLFEIYILRLLIQDKKKLTSQLFTKYLDYSKELSKGIEELAENIYEHSKKENGERQKGIITARIYDKKRLLYLKSNDSSPYFENFEDNELFLDINVIDTGYHSVRKMYLDNIKSNKILFYDKDYAEGIDFDEDIKKIEDQKFKDFYIINPDNLSDHQTNKIISRYGLQYFTHILKERFDSYIKVTSNSEKLNLYNGQNSNQKIENFEFGTSYNCIVPLSRFIPLSQITNVNQIKESSETPTNINTYLTIKDYSLIKFDEIKNKINHNEIINLDSSFIDSEKKISVDKREYISKIADKFLTIPKEYRNNIFCIDSKKIELPASQWLRLLSVLKIYFKNLIIYNISNETVHEIIKNRTSSYIPNNKVFKFWTKESSVIFYSFKKSESFKRFGATALIGETPNDYNYINKKIWKHRYSYRNIFAIKNGKELYEFNKIEIDNKQLLFDENSNLKFFELILKEDNLTLFEKSIQYSLNKNLIDNISKSQTNNKGYKIADTHFKLGSKIHIDDYFYAKRLFQNSFFTTPLAFLLAKEIDKHLKTEKKYTLVGYDSYSELLLSTTRYFLNSFNRDNINHSTFVNNIFSRELNTINENIIIIIPIASTFFTSVKMYQKINELNKNNNGLQKKYKFFSKFYNILLVGDNNFEEKLSREIELQNKPELSEIEKKEKSKYFLNSTFKWSFPENVDLFNEIDIKIFNSKEKLRQKYFLPIYTKWNLANNCRSCYPSSFLNEKVLNATRDIPITPNISLGYPMVYNEDNDTQLNYGNSIYYGNIRSYKNKFLYYIKVNSLVKENTLRITNYIQSIKDELPEEILNEKVVIVTPAKKNQSSFINLINDKIFNFTANCLTISIDEDFINNSRTLYEDSIYGAKYVIYVDDIFATASSFNKINKLISFIRNNKGVDLAITIINRLSFDTELNLKKQLNQNLKKSFYYVSRLFNPNIQEPDREFPLDVESEQYLKISSNSSLNAIKNIYIEKSNSLKEIEIEKIDLIDKEFKYLKKKISRDKTKQLIINSIIYSLFKVELVTNESTTEVVNNSIQTDYKNISLIKEIFEKKNLDILIKYINKKSKFKYINDNNSKFLILKILSRPPIVYHKTIKEAVFYWTLKELDKITLKASSLKTIEDLHAFLYKNKQQEYSDYCSLKFLIKRATQLGSNAVIHLDILNRLKEFINFIHDIKNIKGEECLITKIENLKNKSKISFIRNQCDTFINSIREKNEYSIPNIETDIFKEELNKELDNLSLLFKTNKLRKEIISFKLKDFIYKYVGYVNELIYNYESKAIKLRENLKQIPSKNSFKNGDFEHLIRLLKLENTASIESYYKEFYSKFENKILENDSLNLNTLNDEIKNLIKNSSEDPKLINIEELVCCDKENITKLDKNSSFINYLSLKVLIQFWIKNEYSNLNSVNKINITSQIESILETTSNIIGLKDQNKGGAFLSLNFKNIKESDITPNDIYQFKQYLYETDESEDFYISDIKSENSLTFKMFKGLKSSNSKYNISNFEVIKQNNSLKHRDEIDITNIEEAIEIKYCDLAESDYNIVFISIRDEINDITQAVLTFYINRGKRISEDRLRLLLLLKTDISSLIKIKFNNANLVSYLESELNQFRHGNLSHLFKNIIADYKRAKIDEKNSEVIQIINNFMLYKYRLNEVSYSLNSSSKLTNLLQSRLIFKSKIDLKSIRNKSQVIFKLLFKNTDRKKLIFDIDESIEIMFYEDILLEYIIEALVNISRYKLSEYEFKEMLVIDINITEEYISISNNSIPENINIKKIKLDIKHNKIHGLYLFNKLSIEFFNKPIIVKIVNKRFDLKIPLKK